MIRGLTDSGAIPALERMVQFAAGRQELIANNIANASTPGFRPADVSVADFQRQLGEAIDARRSGDGFAPESSREVTFLDDGVALTPRPIGDNLLFHDGNARNLEHRMQDLSENFLAFRFATTMLRNHFGLLNTAIRGRL